MCVCSDSQKCLVIVVSKYSRLSIYNALTTSIFGYITRNHRFITQYLVVSFDQGRTHTLTALDWSQYFYFNHRLPVCQYILFLSLTNRGT